jgi:hypothetical protein
MEKGLQLRSEDNNSPPSALHIDLNATAVKAIPLMIISYKR